MELNQDLNNVVSITPLFEIPSSSSNGMFQTSNPTLKSNSKRLEEQPLYNYPNGDELYYISDNNTIQITNEELHGWKKIIDNGTIGYIKM
ncbi:hypothetical protein [Chryseobacterium turcicum]|uniref:Uncharacterized protein n=1 Tax=Chryseobacterium turcicum TaxID=2898076 RepID=A0A9Q3YXR7_9FLAO|nr:hypothetical protein [Chryseobacterium turcicum]MCD1117447.1 hypothetical protein [Chryseobacterium turcicum]